MLRRWDIDEVGHGVASARAWLSDLERLTAAMQLDDWVAEEPDEHLLPHLERACAVEGAPLRLHRWSVTEDSVLEVVVAPRSGEMTLGEIRAAAVALLGEVAEVRTFIVERTQDRLFEMVTGVADGDSEFAPHGHAVRLRVDS